MQYIYFLIGPPAIGKSTYTRENLPHCKTVSRDTTAENKAKSLGLAYDELFSYPTLEYSIGDVVPGKEKYGVVVENTITTYKYPIAYENVLRYNHEIDAEVANMFLGYIDEGHDVIIDMTNIRKDRRDIFNLIIPERDDIRKVAVVFNFQGEEMVDLIKKVAHKRHMKSVEKGYGKNITPGMIEMMVSMYEPVTEEERFHEIIHVDNKQGLIGYLEN